MPRFLRPAQRLTLCLPLLVLAACDEVAVANDPVALSEVRGSKSCVAAVNRHLNSSSASLNTVLPVVEINRYVIDVKGGNSWTCVTDEAGQAKELVEITA